MVTTVTEMMTPKTVMILAAEAAALPLRLPADAEGRVGSRPSKSLKIKES
jgi:hypothetical protein